MRGAVRFLVLCIALLVPAPSAFAAAGDLNLFDCIGQGSFGCTDLNPTSGALDGARGVAVSPDGADVYVTAEGAAAISHFRRSGGGTLKYADCIGQGTFGCTDLNPTTGALSGANSVAVSPDGASVYATGYNGDAVVHFTRDPADGDLTFTGCVAQNQTGCTNLVGTADALDGANAVVVSPGGDRVYVTAERSNTVTLLSRDTTDGSIAFGTCQGVGAFGCGDVSAGAYVTDGAYGVAVSPDGGALYVTARDSASVAQFTTFGGLLNLQGCVGQGTFGCTDLNPTANAMSSPTAVVVTPDGENVYVAGRASATVAHLTRDTGNGVLTYADCIGQNAFGCTDLNPTAFALDQVEALAVSPDGTGLYTAARQGYAVTRFAVDGTTGALSFGSCIAQGSIGCNDINASFGALTHASGVAAAPGNLDVYATAIDSNALSHLSRKARPTCADVTVSTAADTPVALSLSCSDVDGDAIARAIVTGPANGTLGAIAGDGSVTYTPAAGFAGNDTFTFRATDVDGASNTATATITVPPIPPAPPPAVVVPQPAPTQAAGQAATATPAAQTQPAAAAPASRFADVVTLPSTRRCVSRRRFRIRLRTGRTKPRSATVFVNGRRVRVLRGARLTSTVDLTGLPAGRFTVKVTIVTADGRTQSDTRRYRTCAPKRKR